MQTSFRKVKYLRVEDPAPVVDPPEITGIHGPGDESGTVSGDADIFIRGTNLALGETGTVKAQLADTEATDSWADLTAYVYDCDFDPEAIAIGAQAWDDELGPSGVHDGSSLRFQVTTPGGTATIEADVHIE